LFIRIVGEKLASIVDEELTQMFPDITGEKRLEIVHNIGTLHAHLLGRFYLLGQQEASMYMPLIMRVIKKAAGK